MKVAIAGACHGELDRVYDAVREVQERHNIKVDLLIICGDVQACRSAEELQTLPGPPSIRSALKDFHQYYAGAKRASVTTIFVGGHYEAPEVMHELSLGGWVAPNVFFLGHAGVVWCGPLRIAGISGLYRSRSYDKGRFETAPYNDSTSESANHVRHWDIKQLLQLQHAVDIMVSYDWPTGIWKHGDQEAILQSNRLAAASRRELQDGSLGNPHAMMLLQKLQPSFWFAANPDLKFPALVVHEDGTHTRFLSLERCHAGNDFLQVLDIDTSSPPGSRSLRRISKANVNNNNNRRHSSSQGEDESFLQIDFDLEWLAVLKLNYPNLPMSPQSKAVIVAQPQSKDITDVAELLRKRLLQRPKNITEQESPCATKTCSRHRRIRRIGAPITEASALHRLPARALRSQFQTRGLDFPGNLDRASLVSRLDAYDRKQRMEQEAEMSILTTAWPVPCDHIGDANNPEDTLMQEQRRQLLEILDLREVRPVRKILKSVHKGNANRRSEQAEAVQEPATLEQEKPPVVTSIDHISASEECALVVPETVEIIDEDDDTALSQSAVLASHSTSQQLSKPAHADEGVVPPAPPPPPLTPPLQPESPPPAPPTPSDDTQGALADSTQEIAVEVVQVDEASSDDCAEESRGLTEKSFEGQQPCADPAPNTTTVSGKALPAEATLGGGESIAARGDPSCGMPSPSQASELLDPEELEAALDDLEISLLGEELVALTQEFAEGNAEAPARETVAKAVCVDDPYSMVLNDTASAIPVEEEVADVETLLPPAKMRRVEQGGAEDILQ